MSEDDTRPTPGDTPKPISRRLRFEIIRRDGNRCTYCGNGPPDVTLTVDHVIPRALGGTNEPSNLVTACKDCNAGKSSTSPDEHVVDAVDERARQWATALERAAAERREAWAYVESMVRKFDDTWSSWKAGDLSVPRDDDWSKSIEQFIAVGLDSADLAHFIPIAMRSKAPFGDKWKYFCGCCWREINDRQKAAMESLDQPQEPAVGTSNTEIEQLIAEAVESARWTYYDQGYADGIHEGRFGSEDGSLAYEDGFRNGSDRVYAKWKRECPNYWATIPTYDDPTVPDLNVDEYIAKYPDDGDWVD